MQTRTVQAGGGVLALANKVEMIVEAGDLPDFGHGKAHPVGKRRKMARRQMPEMVLNACEGFDQQIAARRFIGPRMAAISAPRCGIDKPAFRLVIAFATAGFLSLATVRRRACFVHLEFPLIIRAGLAPTRRASRLLLSPLAARQSPPIAPLGDAIRMLFAVVPRRSGSSVFTSSMTSQLIICLPAFGKFTVTLLPTTD